MSTFEVQLGPRSYPIHIGENILTQVDESIPGDTVFIISNETVAPLYLETVLANCRQRRSHSLVLPDG